VLAALAVLSLALIPIHITTIYSGLPAHPLFLHVPVILIPVATIWALILVAHPAWFTRQGIPLATVTVIALAATNLTIGAGIALRSALHLNGSGGAFGLGGFGGASGTAALVARHAHAADILRLLLIAFTAVLIVAVLAYRVANGMLTGHRGVDGMLARAPTLVLLRVVLAVLAVACAYFVFHTGDLGAKAVWQGRLNGGGGGGGGRPGFSFPGSAGGGAQSGAGG
jgi:hypothetical protein